MEGLLRRLILDTSVGKSYGVSQCAPNTSEGVAEGFRWDRSEPAPSIGEIEKALKSLKPGKAVGPNNIPAELLRIGGDIVA